MSQDNFAPTAVLTPDGLSSAFRKAFRHHPAGVAILTADGRDGPIALTVSSLISVNISPPLVAFSLLSASYSATELLKAETCVIHFPSRHDKALALLCASAGSDRFGADVPWQRLPTGEPRYTDVETWFRARLTNRLLVEGATVVTAEILEGNASENRTCDDALVYLDRQWYGLQPEDELLGESAYMQVPVLGAWRFWP